MAAASPRYFRARLRNADDTADLLVVSSVPSGTNPYLSAPPQGSASSVDLATGETRTGSTTWRLLDPLLGGTYLVTSVLSDATVGSVFYGGVADDPAGPWSESVGRVEDVTLSPANEYAITVSDGDPAEHRAEIFGAPTARFPLITSLLGGPVRGSGDLPALPDKGPWRYQLTDLDGEVAFLNFVGGWVNHGDRTILVRTEAQRMFPKLFPPTFLDEVDWDYVTGTLSPEDSDAVNAIALPFVRPDKTFEASHDISYTYRGQLGVRLARWATLALVAGAEPGGTFELLAQPKTFPFGTRAVKTQLTRGGDLAVHWPSGTAVSDRVVGAEFAVWVDPYRASESLPGWAFGHPVHLARDAHLDAGIGVDAASVTATVDALGPDLRAVLSFPAPRTVAETCAPLYAGYGFTRRYLSAGVVAFVPLRGARTGSSPAPPAVTLTLADLASADPPVYRRRADTAVNRVRVEQAGLDPLEIDPPDAVGVPSRARLGVRPLTIPLPGRLLFAGGGPDDAGLSFFAGVAAEIFARRIGGTVEGELHCLDTPTTAAVREGDEVVQAVPHQVDPAAVPPARGGSRVVVVTSRARDWAGGTFTFGVEDAGASAQLPTAPTVTVAQRALDPRHSATATVTNAAALAALGYDVRLEWTTGAGAPTGNGALLAVIDPAVATTADTPAVNAGTTVQVRAQSVARDGRRPSAFSAWTSVALATIPAPSAFTATAVSGDGGRALLAWTVGDATLPVEVRGRITATEPALKVLAVLPPGSDRLTPEGLVVATGYTFDVRHVEGAPFGGASASASATVTTDAAVPTLTAPLDPLLFSNGAGTIRVSVQATAIPSTTVIEMADESAVGSGTPSTWAPVARLESKADEYVEHVATGIANDGRRSYARAYHTRAGAGNSATTAAVSAFAWEVSVPSGTVPTLPAPTGVSASRLSAALVEVTFTPGASSPSGTLFYPEYATSTGGPWTEGDYGDTASPVQTLAPATPFYWRVRADHAGYISAASAPTGGTV